MKRYRKMLNITKKITDSLIRDKVISESTEDLADTEIEKFKSLTDDVEFTDENSFKEKIEYFERVIIFQRRNQLRLKPS